MWLNVPSEPTTLGRETEKYHLRRVVWVHALVCTLNTDKDSTMVLLAHTATAQLVQLLNLSLYRQSDQNPPDCQPSKLATTATTTSPSVPNTMKSFNCVTYDIWETERENLWCQTITCKQLSVRLRQMPRGRLRPCWKLCEAAHRPCAALSKMLSPTRKHDDY